METIKNNQMEVSELKSKITQWKFRSNNRFKMTEERNHDLEGRTMEITQHKTKNTCKR